MGTLPDESEVFIGRPEDPAAALKSLRESLDPMKPLDGVWIAEDEYQGILAVRVSGPWLVGVSGSETQADALSHLKAALGALSTAAPQGD